MTLPTGLEAMGVGAVLMGFALARPHHRVRRRRHILAPIGLMIELLFFYGGISLALFGLMGLYGQ